MTRPWNLSIEEIQDAILADGRQYIEHRFNDGNDRDCLVMLSKSTNPCALNPAVYADLDPERLAWGRNNRRWCWESVYDYIINGIREHNKVGH